MPRRIQFTNGNVTEYIYSVSGQKLRTIHRTAVPNITVPIGAAIQLIPVLTLSVDSTDYIGNNGKVTISSAPWGTEEVADVHSHGESSAYNENRYYDNNFSGARDGNGKFHSPQQNMSEQTKGDIRSANQNKRPSYLTTPNGSLQKYDPQTGV